MLKPYDHKHLNYDTADFRDLNPTSENLTQVIWDNLSRRLAAKTWAGRACTGWRCGKRRVTTLNTTAISVDRHF